MKLLMCGLAMSLGVIAGDGRAEVMLTVDGVQTSLSVMMENCTNMTGDPVAKVECFNALSQLLDEQTGAGQDEDVSVGPALDALRSVAQYQDDGSGLYIAGTDCKIHVVYYNNYFHISRRNVSSIDLFSAEFDASKVQADKIAEVQGAQAPLYSGLMADGLVATSRGGVALESNTLDFEPKSARTPLDAYAQEVVGQLQATESQEFDFVLIHPERSQVSADILRAFETFVNACQS